MEKSTPSNEPNTKPDLSSLENPSIPKKVHNKCKSIVNYTNCVKKYLNRFVKCYLHLIFFLKYVRCHKWYIQIYCLISLTLIIIHRFFESVP